VPQQYTGKELDPETDLYYFGARYYDPRTQVWQTPDPALESYLDGKPNGGVFASANLAAYTYAENRPVNYVDPDGQVPWKEFAWGVAKGAAVGVVAGVAIGALIASGGTLAPAIGYAAIAVGTVMTVETTREVITGKDLSGNKLTDEQRADMAGQVVGGFAGGFTGGRLGVRLGGRIAAARAPAAPEVAPEAAPSQPQAGLTDLAGRRAAENLPPAGPKSPTLARLDVQGKAPIYGRSAHGRDVTLRVNPISRTHAETDVMQQVMDAGGAKGAKATLYVDHPDGMCGACGRSGAVRSMARQVGISELTVIWPGGSTVIVP
jgi:RHS repeat-associated protein